MCQYLGTTNREMPFVPETQPSVKGKCQVDNIFRDVLITAGDEALRADDFVNTSSSVGVALVMMSPVRAAVRVQWSMVPAHWPENIFGKENIFHFFIAKSRIRPERRWLP